MALLLHKGAASTALRTVAARVAVPSSKTLASHRGALPLMAARSLTCSSASPIGIGASPRDERPSISSLGSSLSNLSLQHNGNRSLSSVAPQSNNSNVVGEPITYLTLNNLSDNPGARRKGRRVGRGIGSSKGKTCGRGHKGQKARAGKGVHPTFEGGQTKFYKRLPKTGKMKNAKFKLELIPINVGTVQNYVTMGRLLPERSDGVITMRDMVRAGMFPHSAVKSGIKLLGDGAEWVKDPLLLEVPWASASAIAAVEAAGGFVTTVHYNRLAVRAHLKPEKFPLKPEAMLAAEGRGDDEEMDVHDMHLLPRRARPPPKYMPYYTDYAKRGYLNPRVQLERKRRGLKEILITH